MRLGPFLPEAFFDPPAGAALSGAEYAPLPSPSSLPMPISVPAMNRGESSNALDSSEMYASGAAGVGRGVGVMKKKTSKQKKLKTKKTQNKHGFAGQAAFHQDDTIDIISIAPTRHQIAKPMKGGGREGGRSLNGAPMGCRDTSGAGIA